MSPWLFFSSTLEWGQLLIYPSQTDDRLSLLGRLVPRNRFLNPRPCDKSMPIEVVHISAFFPHTREQLTRRRRPERWNRDRGDWRRIPVESDRIPANPEDIGSYSNRHRVGQIWRSETAERFGSRWPSLDRIKGPTTRKFNLLPVGVSKLKDWKLIVS